MASEYTTRVSGDTSKWGLSASRQQCGDVEGASVSWNSDQGAGPARAYPAISIMILLVELFPQLYCELRGGREAVTSTLSYCSRRPNALVARSRIRWVS